ncbi:hypothetical protein [Streptomyces sp. bgisy060]|uniref:hypothetical protein n=1 Tax=Streptomyces sp. bgisy060 TaxID=3413775 RepID=UPI003EBECFEB
MDFSLPIRTAVATRARIAAAVCRERYAPPLTMSALRSIAGHFDDAATACESASFEFTRVVEPLAKAYPLMNKRPETRMPTLVLTYILNPFAPEPLPAPVPLLPATARLAAQDEALHAELTRLHADTEAAANDTETWLRAVLAVLAKKQRLSRAVDVDNRRPENRRAVIAKHIACPECSGHDVRFTVREWAHCSCGYGDMAGQFLACHCFSWDCPGINALAELAAAN